MLRLVFILILLVGLALPAGEVAAQSPTPPPGPRLDSPVAGAALQGSVVITGSSQVDGFDSAEVAFAYSANPDSWFLIQQSFAPVAEGTLAVWDTSTIADGSYRLRLIVYLKNGSQLSQMVPDLRVRNYTPIETSTPTLKGANATNVQTSAVTPLITLTPTLPTSTPISTPTPLPINPAEIQPGGLIYNGLLGLGFVVVLFLLLGLYRASGSKREE